MWSVDDAGNRWVTGESRTRADGSTTRASSMAPRAVHKGREAGAHSPRLPASCVQTEEAFGTLALWEVAQRTHFGHAAHHVLADVGLLNA